LEALLGRIFEPYLVKMKVGDWKCNFETNQRSLGNKEELDRSTTLNRSGTTTVCIGGRVSCFSFSKNASYP
jgi:hypothetical protein